MQTWRLIGIECWNWVKSSKPFQRNHTAIPHQRYPHTISLSLFHSHTAKHFAITSIRVYREWCKLRQSINIHTACQTPTCFGAANSGYVAKHIKKSHNRCEWWNQTGAQHETKIHMCMCVEALVSNKLWGICIYDCVYFKRNSKWATRVQYLQFGDTVNSSYSFEIVFHRKRIFKSI